jgi:hypothetical protein
MTSSEGSSTRGDGSAPITDVVRAGAEAFSAVYGRQPDTVSGVQKVDEGWRLDVEVTELERIPPSTTVMATYEVDLDSSGEMQGYRRKRRYYRNQADGQ